MVEATREAIGFLEVSTPNGIPSRFIAPHVTVREYGVILPSVKRQEMSHIQTQPSILPIRITKSMKPPIMLQEGIAANDRYELQRNLLNRVTRRPTASAPQRPPSIISKIA